MASSRPALLHPTAVLLLSALPALQACGGAEPEPTKPAPVASVRPAAAADALFAADAGGAAGVKVRLLAFNDFHGSLKPPTGKVPKVEGPVGGAAYFAAHMKKLAEGHPNHLIVAAGDIIGASPITSALFHDEPTIAVMNAIGLSVTSMGNHELDEGIDELLRLKNGGCHPKDGCKFEPTYAGAKFDILGANVTRTDSKAPVFPPYVVREVGGVPIAFIGLPLEATPHSVAPEGTAGLSFAGEVETINGLVPEIRKKGVEAIIVLIHQGGEVRSPGLDECNDFKGAIIDVVQKLDPAVDAVVSAHSHALYNCKVNGRVVTSGSSFGRVITTLDLEIDPKTKDVVKVEAHNHAVTQDLPPDPVVQAIVEKAAAVAAPIENRPIGRITETLTAGGRGGTESVLGSIVADAELEATKKLGAKVALVNSAGVRSDILFARSGDEREDGIVTYGEAFAAQPFGNRLVTITVTGAQLVSAIDRELKDDGGLLFSEGFVVRVAGKVGDKRTITLELGGKPVAPTAKVRLTTNSFLADRNPDLHAGTNRVNGPGDLEALETYFKSHKLVSPPKKPRIVRQ